jgi:hypothetical protein
MAAHRVVQRSSVLICTPLLAAGPRPRSPSNVLHQITTIPPLFMQGAMHKLHPECYTILFRVITIRTNLPAGTADQGEGGREDKQETRDSQTVRS